MGCVYGDTGLLRRGGCIKSACRKSRHACRKCLHLRGTNEGTSFACGVPPQVPLHSFFSQSIKRFVPRYRSTLPLFLGGSEFRPRGHADFPKGKITLTADFSLRRFELLDLIGFFGLFFGTLSKTIFTNCHSPYKMLQYNTEETRYTKEVFYGKKRTYRCGYGQDTL